MALAAFVSGPLPRARATANGPSASITLAQDEHDHEDPTLGVDERPWVNLAFPAAMIVAGLLYLAVTNRRRGRR